MCVWVYVPIQRERAEPSKLLSLSVAEFAPLAEPWRRCGRCFEGRRSRDKWGGAVRSAGKHTVCWGSGVVQECPSLSPCPSVHLTILIWLWSEHKNVFMLIVDRWQLRVVLKQCKWWCYRSLPIPCLFMMQKNTEPFSHLHEIYPAEEDSQESVVEE